MDWLSGKAHLSKTYEYKIKSIINRKIKALYEFELPLILKSGLFPEAEMLVTFKNIMGALIIRLLIIQV